MFNLSIQLGILGEVGPSRDEMKQSYHVFMIVKRTAPLDLV